MTYIPIIAFLAELVDSVLGMSFGTILTPLLVAILNLEPKVVVPLILISELCTGLLCAITHSQLKKTYSFKLELPTTLSLLPLSVVGACLGSLFVIKSPMAKHYMGWMLLSIGFLLLFVRIFGLRLGEYRWWKGCLISLVASVNKAITGGGFGPILMTGLVATGRTAKASVAVTSMVEAVVCAVALVAYTSLVGINTELLTHILVGSVAAAVLSAYVIFWMPEKWVRILIGCDCIFMGAWILFKLYG